MIPVISALVFIAALSFVWGLFLFFSRNSVSERLYSTAGVKKEKKEVKEYIVHFSGILSSQLPFWLSDLLLVEDLAYKLDVAGWKIKTRDFVGIRAAATGLGAVIGSALMGTLWWFGLLIGVFAGFALPQALLEKSILTVQAKIRRALPLFLEQMSAAVTAGVGGFEQALMWGCNGNALHDEIQRLLQEVRSGVSMEDALENMAIRADRIGLPDLAGVAQTLSYAYRHGGGLAGSLENIIRDVRMRQGVLISERAKRLENAVTLPVILAVLFAAVAAIVSPMVMVMYKGSGGLLF